MRELHRSCYRNTERTTHWRSLPPELEAQLKAQAAEKHGTGEAGCDSEKKARGETANSPEARIADFRAKIADRKAETGKEYLSFYFMEADSYEVE